MYAKTSLVIILIIAIAGILFSGYLSYKEQFAKTCSVGNCGPKILGLPVCVYGLVMYIIIFVIALMGILGK